MIQNVYHDQTDHNKQTGKVVLCCTYISAFNVTMCNVQAK